MRSNSPPHLADEINRSPTIRKETLNPKIKLRPLKNERPRAKSPDPVKAGVLPVTLDGGILSRRLMRRNCPFTAINATHLPDSLKEGLITIFLSSISFSFLHLMKRKEDDMSAHISRFSVNNKGRRSTVAVKPYSLQS